MSEINLQLRISDNNSYRFKRAVRKLLESTFILRDKDEKLYSFLSRESNRADVSEYLRMIGFDLLTEEKSGVCMLIQSEEDEETVGLKRANVITFSTLQYHMLLVLWKCYLETLGFQEGSFITRGELIEKLKSYGLLLTRPEFSAAMKLFKKYSLIDFDDNESGEEMRIRLYPSLQFGWDIPQFQTVAEEYLDKAEKNSGVGSENNSTAFILADEEGFSEGSEREPAEGADEALDFEDEAEGDGL